MKPVNAALCIGLLLFVAGCAVKPIYRGTTYDAFPEALKAQQAYFDQERPKLKSPGIHVDSSIRVVLPSRQYFKTHGVTGTPREDVLNYLLDATEANVSTIPETIRKADVFRDISVEYYESPGRPNAARGEFALWLQLPNPRTPTWTLLAGPDNTEQRLLTVTGLDQGAERLNIWVQDLAEAARKLSQPN